MAARGWRGKEGEVSVKGLILHLLLLAEKERCLSTNPNFLFFHISYRIMLSKVLKLKCLKTKTSSPFLFSQGEEAVLQYKSKLFVLPDRQ
jgi:hypothetical protein